MEDFRTDEADEAISSTELTVSELVMPDQLFILPTIERPFFPAQVSPVIIEEKPWLRTVRMILKQSDKLAGLLQVKTKNLGHTRSPRIDDFYDFGCVIKVHNPIKSEGSIQFIAEGIRRFHVQKWLSEKIPYKVLADYPNEVSPKKEERIRAYSMAIMNTIKDLVKLNPLYTEELKFFLERFTPSDPSSLTDFAVSLTSANQRELQDVLESLHIQRRMEKTLVLLKKELDVAKLQVEIRGQVDETISTQQRKFFLREQLKVIQRELGIAKDDRSADLDLFRSRLEGLKLSAEAAQRVDQEMNKLSMLELGSPEYAVTRNYLDWVTQLPWGHQVRDKLGLQRARRILNEDHYGLDDVKDRITEFLAVAALKGEVQGAILLLVGPPGVGKTSLGRSVARVLGRPFYRFSVGGMRDEAEIKGHRRTYIGAMPGKMAEALKHTGVDNPVIMLDEIDKMGASYQGDPASALLEVLDPEQNVEFLDHYLDLRLDLSHVLFICTANQTDTIPQALLDRMEEIRLSGYILEEKLNIAKQYLLPRQLKMAGLKSSQFTVTDAAMRQLIDGYAREAGVRGLEKQIKKLIRKCAVEVVRGKQKRLGINGRNLHKYLGVPIFDKESSIEGVGVVTGLAWTSMGGAILPIEARRLFSDKPGYKITGNVGEVMQESAEIALSFANAFMGVKDDFFQTACIHIHVPEGAVPKDGPSAGITLATALLSLAYGKKVPSRLAMTGELTLTGQVFPVGGIREKIVAARRAHIRKILMPAKNKNDFEELPAYLREGLTVHFVSNYQQVHDIVFD
ncbi:MAG: endopeptidase La [Gammaproteobacteria bacterium]|nr:MAG: endopeptidase La [Gammaproteobacteria bacterium]